MRLLGEAFDAGVDPLDLSSSLIEWIRFLMIVSIDPGSNELLSLTGETRESLSHEVEGVSTEHLLSLLSMLTEAENNIKRAGHQRYLLESVLLRMSTVKSIARIGDLISLLKKGGDVSGSGSEPPGEKAKADTASKPAKPAAKKPAKGGSAKAASGDMVGMWQDLIESLRETKASLASILDLCEPPRVSEGVYWLQLPSSFHESQVLKGQNLRILTREMEKLTNTTVVLKTQVKATGKEDDVDLSAIVEKDPVVRALVENLGGKIVGVRQQKRDGSQGEIGS
jgi:DNA polymerase III gamma/tau subunit